MFVNENSLINYSKYITLEHQQEPFWINEREKHMDQTIRLYDEIRQTGLI